DDPHRLSDGALRTESCGENQEGGASVDSQRRGWRGSGCGAAGPTGRRGDLRDGREPRKAHLPEVAGDRKRDGFALPRIRRRGDGTDERQGLGRRSELAGRRVPREESRTPAPDGTIPRARKSRLLREQQAGARTVQVWALLCRRGFAMVARER